MSDIIHPLAPNRPHHVRNDGGPVAAGADYTLTPPARQWCELLSLRIRLVTDATAADRRIILVYGGATDDDSAIVCPVTQPASQTWDYWFLKGFGDFYNGSTDGFITMGLPVDVRIQNPEQWRTEINNLQAGDQITLWNYRYHSWLDPVMVA